jgi:hypothetical protein
MWRVSVLVPCRASVSNSINNTDTRSFSYEESKSTAIEINMPESDKDTVRSL